MTLNYSKNRLKEQSDWLELYDGSDTNAPRIGERLCGATIPTTIYSSGNELFLRFHSDDSSDKDRGFRLNVQEAGNICHIQYWLRVIKSAMFETNCNSIQKK